ncbi:MAG: ABC transporter permease subunit, partial [Candidatus Latescibacteria bacterium]|nr:ABC transporter permease subunit [Candidatus Latescibacterota bacterium]
MLFFIIMREFRHNILSLRLHLSLILTIVVFSLGTIAFVNNYKLENGAYKRYNDKEIENMRSLATSNLSQLAVQRKNQLLEPRSNSFINDSREKYLPNSFEYNSYNVFGFTVKPGSINPYLQPFLELNWTFVISIIIGFTVFLFTFDSISGEKESRTLAISLANSVSRGTLLFGKYLSVLLTTAFVLIPGLCISLIIIFISGAIQVNAVTVMETAGFFIIGMTFIACIAAFGMLASVLSKSANVSML